MGFKPITNELGWRRGEGSYHYYKDSVGGYGYIQSTDEGWLAGTYYGSGVFQTLKEAKKFVEKTVKKWET